MRRIATWAVVAVVALVALVAAGCSGKSTSTTATTLAKDAAAAALVPPAVAGKATVTVAMDASYPPDEFVGTDGRTIMGFDADLANAIGPVLGLKVVLQNATFDTIIPGLSSGKFDLSLSSITDNKDREKQLDFVTYFSSGEGFYVPANSNTVFDGLDSICGHTIAVESGTVEKDDADAQVKACSTAGKQADNVLVFQDQSAANLAVSSGRAQGGFVDSQVAENIVKQSNGQFKLTGKPFGFAPYGIAMAKNGMAKAVLAAVKVLLANGTYGKILAKWKVQSGAVTTPVINGAIS